MTYIDLINKFWDSTRFNPCSSNEAMMYFYLLHQANIRRWINPFEFKTRDLELTLDVTRATIIAVRNKLKQRGLIDFIKGAGKGKAVYLICGAKTTDKELSDKFNVQLLNDKLNNTLNNSLNIKLNANANSTLYNEDIRLKTKDTLLLPNGIVGVSDVFEKCCNELLGPTSREYQEQIRMKYGIEDLEKAFQEFRGILVELDMLDEIRSRKDFTRLFVYKYCLPQQRNNSLNGPNGINERVAEKAQRDTEFASHVAKKLYGN